MIGWNFTHSNQTISEANSHLKHAPASKVRKPRLVIEILRFKDDTVLRKIDDKLSSPSSLGRGLRLSHLDEGISSGVNGKAVIWGTR